MSINEEDKQMIREVIEIEGFDYAFCDYSNFDDIKDVEFHRAKREYIEAAKRLKQLLEME